MTESSMEAGATSVDIPASIKAPIPTTTPDFRATKHKVKVNGAEQEVDYDELIRDYQIRKASDEKFRQAKELESRIAKERGDIENFKKDPWGTLKSAGIDPHQVAENLLLDKLKWEQMTDEQREAIQARQEADKYKSEAQKAREEFQKQQMAQMQASAIQEIDTEISGALNELGKKPTPRLIARIAETMLAHLEAKNGERMPAKQALDHVHNEYMSDLVEYTDGLSPKELRKILSKKSLDGLREDEVKDVLAQDPIGSRKIVRDIHPPKQAQPKRMSTDDFFGRMDKKFGGR